MSSLSWNEIKTRAVQFSKDWQGASNENAEKQSFYDAFFNVFGISRRRVATFEVAVKKQGGKQGFIDLFWKGILLVEHKSKGKDLQKAFEQAKDYFPGLKEHELPKYILVSDFENFILYDLENRTEHHFSLATFADHVALLGFIAGYQKRTFQEQDPVNVIAAERMGKLHDSLLAIGYKGHALEMYLVRLLFCLFAEDTGIFERGIFQEYIEQQTKEDGSDLALHLAQIFQILNTPADKRLLNLEDGLNAFPYVNGDLFAETLPFASFDSKMREILLYACALDWSKISPAIFGAMFQSVMNPQERRYMGAHYTSEKNIFKVIKPLFLDDLYKDFAQAKGKPRKLQELQNRIAKLNFLDPACGCGNFLIITYRELRLLELQILKELYQNQQVMAIAEIVKVDITQFYGIEYDEFPARIAEVALWLIDHQMNRIVSDTFGQYFVRIPLKKTTNIVNGNALQIDWNKLLKAENPTFYTHEINIIEAKEPENTYNNITIHAKNVYVHTETSAIAYIQAQHNQFSFDYILGNPPFVGSKIMSEAQRKDLLLTFGQTENVGVLDYVSAWYYKAAQYCQNHKTKVAFVSTNSITQGEQVGILWNILKNRFHISIHFAHQTFKWTNEAKGKAAVYCVIIGFANYPTKTPKLYQYEDIKGEAQENEVSNINAYLLAAKDVLIFRRNAPIANVPAMSFGNMPLDGGHLLLDDKEKEALLKKEPQAQKFIKPLISAKEFLNGENRWCIWLVNAKPNEIKAMPEIIKRVQAVKTFREKSVAPSTRKFALQPTLFRDKNNPDVFIVIPSTSSENRKYIPMALFDKEYIANNSCHIIPDGDLYLFGILMSALHHVWIKYTCGRLKSDYRYSKDIVYNNFPFPMQVSEKQKQTVMQAAQHVLNTRKNYPNSSLADLYDPLTMPLDLLKAHQALDKAVDVCYRPQPFVNEASRMEYLFLLYEQYVFPLLVERKKKGK